MHLCQFDAISKFGSFFLASRWFPLATIDNCKVVAIETNIESVVDQHQNCCPCPIYCWHMLFRSSAWSAFIRADCLFFHFCLMLYSYFLLFLYRFLNVCLWAICICRTLISTFTHHHYWWQRKCPERNVQFETRSISRQIRVENSRP